VPLLVLNCHTKTGMGDDNRLQPSGCSFQTLSIEVLGQLFTVSNADAKQLGLSNEIVVQRCSKWYAMLYYYAEGVKLECASYCPAWSSCWDSWTSFVVMVVKAVLKEEMQVEVKSSSLYKRF
jgi:molybdopterin-containing oxidoreductase family iron-sulfur binding subunit